MASASRKTSKPGMAGRSADARGETGTGADAAGPVGAAPSIGQLTGIPSTVDAGVQRRTGVASDAAARRPVDRNRPDERDVGMDSGKGTPLKPARSPGELAQSGKPGASDDEGTDSALESLGKAVSAPVRDLADDKPGRRRRER